MNLAGWAETLFGVVEQDGATTGRIKMVTPMTGDVWHTWFAPFPSPEEWETSAESHLRGLEAQSSGRQQVVFVAESKAGEVLSQLPWKIVGKLAQGNLESAQQASAAVFGSLAQTMERITELGNRSLDAANRQLELSLSAQIQQMELLRAYREREFTAAEEAAPSPFVQMLQTYGPQIAGALELAFAAIAQKQQAIAKVHAAPAPAPEPEPEAPEPPAPTPKGKPRKAPPHQTIVRKR